MLRYASVFRLMVSASPALCISLSAPAQQTPSLPSLVSAVAASSPLAEDVRLERKVALHVEGLPIGELLEQLSAKTGVTFTAQKDIAEENVIAFVPARPLRATLEDIAALFNNQWERIENDKVKGEAVRYRLIRGARAREYEDSLLRGPRERMMAQMEPLVQALAETPEQLRQRPANDIVRACLLDPDRRLATQIYSAFGLPQREQLFARGCTPGLFFSNLAPPQQDTLRQWLNVHNALEQKRDEAEHLEQQPYPRRLSDTIPAGVFEQGAVRLVVLGNVSAGEADVRLEIKNATYLPLRHLRDDKPSRLPRHGNPYTGQAVSSQSRLPAPKDLQAASQEKNWIDQLYTLSQATSRPILTDYFRSATQRNADINTGASSVPIPDTSVLMAQLDSFSRAMQRVWWARGDTLLLRTQQWYRQRQYETPDSWMRSVSRKLRAQGGIPTYADVGRVLELTPEQLFGLRDLYDPVPAIAAAGDRTTDGALESARLIYELKGTDHRPMLRVEAPQARSKPMSGLAVKADDAAAGSRTVTFAELPCETLPDAARSLAMEALAADYGVCYTEPLEIRYAAYCEYPTIRIPAPPNPDRDKMIVEDLRRSLLPGISAEEKQELDAALRANVLRQANYLMFGPRKRDERYVKVRSMVRLIVPNSLDKAQAPGHEDGGARAVLPLIIPDDRHDKTKIEISAE